MNSTLQCLVHTPPFVDYFLKDYSDDINEDNPLGMRGELATAVGELLRKLWSSGKNAVAPRFFKTELARFAPHFSGYNQHDCQEMLSFLLDGLHEDLNKVKQKSYTESKDSDGRPDDEVAEEMWKYHKARNDSVIVDVCQGQYKSTLVCPDCGKFSITFDPFMYLTLPLPTSLTRSMTVSVFYGDRTPYTVTVPKDGSLGDLSNAIGAACGLKDDESLLLADVYAHKVYKYLETPLLSLSEIRDNDRIVAYRFNQMHRGPGKAKLEILHSEQKQSDFGRDAEISGKLFGIPLVAYVNTERHSGSDIDAVISGLLSPLHRTHSPAGSLEDTTVGEKEFSFSVFWLDRYSSGLKPLESDFVPNPLSATRLVVKWDEKEHEKYDSSSYLNDLPEVYKETSSVAEEASEQEAELVEVARDFCVPPKIDTFVNFPIHDLDLSKYVKNKEGESYLYELYAISNHEGGMGGGHYTAYAKLMDENKWYEFDDRRVSAIDESKIKSSAAYVLFYRRVRSESEASSMDED
ncbi:hypothetical protein DY000_02048760 [Brassica cretica]|uniref:USP domain-containing protein n=1 Tax=Brassica cretica TaxID=69181 RepID=A0ABQ7F4S1_BRACR|nr:hypothetical protein DY000_02048760 [Brassica cretica]